MAHTTMSLTRDEMNEAIAVPRKIVADDGREFMLREWTPSVVYDGCIEVTIKALVLLPDKK
jgi:hypothetical protein